MKAISLTDFKAIYKNPKASRGIKNGRRVQDFIARTINKDPDISPEQLFHGFRILSNANRVLNVFQDKLTTTSMAGVISYEYPLSGNDNQNIFVKGEGTLVKMSDREKYFEGALLSDVSIINKTFFGLMVTFKKAIKHQGHVRLYRSVMVSELVIGSGFSFLVGYDDNCESFFISLGGCKSPKALIYLTANDQGEAEAFRKLFIEATSDEYREAIRLFS